MPTPSRTNFAWDLPVKTWLALSLAWLMALALVPASAVRAQEENKKAAPAKAAASEAPAPAAAAPVAADESTPQRRPPC